MVLTSRAPPNDGLILLSSLRAQSDTSITKCSTQEFLTLQAQPMCFLSGSNHTVSSCPPNFPSSVSAWCPYQPLLTGALGASHRAASILLLLESQALPERSQLAHRPLWDPAPGQPHRGRGWGAAGLAVQAQPAFLSDGRCQGGARHREQV